MMPSDELEELALAVADGAEVDWSRVLDGPEGEVGALRLIEEIAAGHRGESQPSDAG